MEQDDARMEPRRAKAALRKIKHAGNSTQESIASTNREGEELISFMADQFVELVEQSHNSESQEYEREMGRKALFGDLLYGGDVQALDAEARRIGYRRNPIATDWILRVVSKGAQHHLANFEAGTRSDIDLTQGNDTTQETPSSEMNESVTSNQETTTGIIDLDDTVRRLYEEGTLVIYKAQALLVAFGKAESPRSNDAVANTIILTFEDLRRRSTLYSKGDTPLKRFIEAYLVQLAESGAGRDPKDFIDYSEKSWASLASSVAEDASLREIAESMVARELIKMYPATKSKPR
ncbi:MAG: hypothetical protein V4678_01495 [Patescibacteria group bacterium]